MEQEQRSAARASGLNVIGDFTADIGLGEAASRTLNAILERGIPVSYTHLPYVFERRSTHIDPRWSSLPRGNLYPTSFIYYNIDQMFRIDDARLHELTAGKYTIAYWVWELPRIPERFLPEFSRVDEIWVPSRFVRESMLPVAKTPVTVIPHPVEVKPSVRLDRTLFGIPEDRYVFLFSFSATSSFARKNPWGVIDAFERAFGRSSKGGPLLVIKAHHLDLNAKLQDALQDAVRRVGGILLQRSYSRQEMSDLLACADAYVSLHRSEGFGLGMAESMYLGKPVIATYHSSNVDYMNADNSYPVECRLRAITEDDHRHEPHMALHYEPGQLWAEPDIEVAAYWMRHVYEHQEEARSRGGRAAEDIRRYCSPAVVGRLVEERLIQIERSPRKPKGVSVSQDRKMEIQKRHREALEQWKLVRHISECVPMAHRPVIGPVASGLARLPVIGRLIRGVQRVRFSGALSERQLALNQISFEDDQLHFRLVAAMNDAIVELQNDMSELRTEIGALAQEVRSGSIETRLASSMSRLEDRLNATVSDVDRRLQEAVVEIEERLHEEAERQGATGERITEQLQRATAQSSAVEQRLDQELNAMRMRFLRAQRASRAGQVVTAAMADTEGQVEPSHAQMEQQNGDAGVPVPVSPVQANGPTATQPFDYFMFEQRFRGSMAEVKRRQSQYVDLFRGCRNVLDLGCGRGEFLDLLSDSGIPVTGVDTSEDMVDFCRDRGHHAELGDAFEYLDRLPDGSIDGIFAAQLIEHFQPERIFGLITLSARKLKSGGVMVVETVNSHCPAAMTHFYLDPTHVRPVPPDMLEFGFEQEPFQIECLRFSSPLPGSGAQEVLEVKSERPDDIALYRDYAVVATRR